MFQDNYVLRDRQLYGKDYVLTCTVSIQNSLLVNTTDKQLSLILHKAVTVTTNTTKYLTTKVII